MYQEIGAFDAKAKLSELLRKIERGERFTITLRGKPVADLIPSRHRGDAATTAAIDALERMPKIKNVSPEELAEYIAEGRM